MTSLTRCAARGLVAGAVGVTALNAVTYLDMAVRGRPASSTPQRAAERAAERLGVPLPGDEEQRQARAAGLGPLLGAAAGAGAGLVLGVLRGAGWPDGRAATVGVAWLLAMLAGNAPMTLLGVTDPRAWSARDWVADAVPHLGYALAAAATLDALEGR